jgi:hypothetical protein
MFKILISSDAAQSQAEMFGNGGQTQLIIGPLPELPPPPLASTSDSGLTEVQEYHAQCTTANILTCVPVCNATHHGYELLANIDGTDTKFSCNLANMLFSWMGASTEGGYLGADHQSFVTSIISGAAGSYVLSLRATVLVTPTQVHLSAGQNAVIGGTAGAIWRYTGQGAAFVVVAESTLAVNSLAIGAPQSAQAFLVADGTTLRASNVSLEYERRPAASMNCASLGEVVGIRALTCEQISSTLTISGPVFISTSGIATGGDYSYFGSDVEKFLAQLDGGGSAVLLASEDVMAPTTVSIANTMIIGNGARRKWTCASSNGHALQGPGPLALQNLEFTRVDDTSHFELRMDDASSELTISDCTGRITQFVQSGVATVVNSQLQIDYFMALAGPGATPLSSFSAKGSSFVRSGNQNSNIDVNAGTFRANSSSFTDFSIQCGGGSGASYSNGATAVFVTDSQFEGTPDGSHMKIGGECTATITGSQFHNTGPTGQHFRRGAAVFAVTDAAIGGRVRPVVFVRDSVFIAYANPVDPDRSGRTGGSAIYSAGWLTVVSTTFTDNFGSDADAVCCVPVCPASAPECWRSVDGCPAGMLAENGAGQSISCEDDSSKGR